MPAPSVMLHNGRPATTSLEVAKFFDKPHKNVVRDIRNLIANCPKKFTGLNFELSSYLDNTGRSLPMFIIFKDGFTLLVMGYTGPEAMRFKLAYIEAFNALEAELQRQREGALPPAPRKFSPSSTVSRKPLERLVKVWASQSGLLHAQCWTMLNSHFGLEKITELPEEWIAPGNGGFYIRGKECWNRKSHAGRLRSASGRRNRSRRRRRRRRRRRNGRATGWRSNRGKRGSCGARALCW